MIDLWTERADSYRESEAHREGQDLDLIVEWSRGARTALDVATGGGHVARRLRETGLDVLTADAAPGMRPDVICQAEDLPFADVSFDAVCCRVAAHHFVNPAAAIRELARVSRNRVLVSDNLFVSAAGEDAERLRDETHVRNYTDPEWRTFFEGAGLRVEEVRELVHRVALEPWLERTECGGEAAHRVRSLLSDRIEDGRLELPRIVLRGVLA